MNTKKMIILLLTLVLLAPPSIASHAKDDEGGGFGDTRTKYVLNSDTWIIVRHVLTKELIGIYGLYVNPLDSTDYILTEGRPHIEGHPVGDYYRSQYHIYDIDGVKLVGHWMFLYAGIAYVRDGQSTNESSLSDAYFVE